MLNKKEIALINSKIAKYRKWAKEEESRARRERDKNIQEDHYLQARLNEESAATLALLLTELLPQC